MGRKKQRKLCGVYKIENIINNKIYIGSSSNITRRWVRHKSDLKTNNHSNVYLQREYNKYRIDNFIYTIIEECDENIILDKEQYWIDYYNSCNNQIGYNLTPIAGRIKITADIREKMSNSRKGKYFGENAPSSKVNTNTVKEIIEYLKQDNLSLLEIAELYNVSKSIVYGIYAKKTWLHLTKDIIFYKRKSGCSKLTEKEVIEIIELLKNNFKYDDIANIYHVANSTILDIKGHNSWQYLTKDIIFDRCILRGEDHPSSKLTEIDVLKIREKLNNGELVKNIAIDFNISKDTIRAINNGKLWSHMR